MFSRHCFSGCLVLLLPVEKDELLLAQAQRWVKNRWIQWCYQGFQCRKFQRQVLFQVDQRHVV